MNGKLAKQMRRAAAQLEHANNKGEPAPWRMYTKGSKDLIWAKTKPGGFFLPIYVATTYEPKLEPWCVRAVYQKIKRQYRRAIKKGANRR